MWQRQSISCTAAADLLGPRFYAKQHRTRLATTCHPDPAAAMNARLQMGDIATKHWSDWHIMACCTGPLCTDCCHPVDLEDGTPACMTSVVVLSFPHLLLVQPSLAAAQCW
jgi:hypothetical protein